MSDERRRLYPALDSMRAIASIAVVGTHTAFWSGQYNKGTLGAATGRLDIGVAIFFVLSGFLLSVPLLVAAARRTPSPSTAQYVWKRGLRVLPVYWVCVAGALLLLPSNNGAPPSEWVANLTLTDLYQRDPLPHGLTQMWSLSTEVAFYLLLPALMLVVVRALCRQDWRPGRITGVLAAGCVLNVVWLGDASTRLFPGHGAANQWLPGNLTWFAVGIAFAVAVVHRDTQPRERWGWAGVVARLGQSPWTCWLGALALFAVACTPLAGPVLLTAPTAGEAVVKNLLYAVCSALLVLPAVFADPRSRFMALMSHRLPRHLGHISYSLFCCHLIVLELIFDWRGMQLFDANGMVLFGLTLGASLVVAETLYRVVELPFLRLKNRKPRGPQAPPATMPKATTTAS